MTAETAQKFLLECLADPHVKRRGIANLYRGLLAYDGVDWVEINHAILDRWSKESLRWIKREANR